MNRINLIEQWKAFDNLCISGLLPGVTGNYKAVYFALLSINNVTYWSETFDVDFMYILNLSKVDKDTYRRAMDLFNENGLFDSYQKGVNKYARAKVSLKVLIGKPTGNTVGNGVSDATGNTVGNGVSDAHFNKTLNNKQKNRESFVPPAPDDVFIFFKEQKVWDEKKCAAEAAKFCDHYAGIGWVAGSGQKIVSWESVAAGWITKDSAFGNNGKSKVNGAGYNFPDHYDRGFAQSCDQPKLKAYFEYLEAEGWYKDGTDKHGAIWKKRDE